MGYAEEAMAELHGDRMIDNTPPTVQAAYAETETTDWRRELEKRGREIDSAMGRYRGTEPLIEAVKRLANDYHEATVIKSRVLQEVDAELAKARATHAPMNGHHEGYAVILEELDELWEVCKRNTHSFAVTRPDWATDVDVSDKDTLRQRKRAAMRKEAMQVAAMAVRLIEDVCDKS